MLVCILYWLRSGLLSLSKISACVLAYYLSRECLMRGYVMLSWFSRAIIQFSLYYLWCPNLYEKLGWLNKYGVCFSCCGSGLLLSCIRKFLLCWDRFETLCIGHIALSLTKVCTLAYKIMNCWDYMFTKECTRVLFTLWPVSCDFSVWLLNLVSAFTWNLQGIKYIHVSFVCLVFSWGDTSAFQNCVHGYAFCGEPHWVFVMILLRSWSGEDAVSSLIVVFWPVMKFQWKIYYGVWFALCMLC